VHGAGWCCDAATPPATGVGSTAAAATTVDVGVGRRWAMATATATSDGVVGVVVSGVATRHTATPQVRFPLLPPPGVLVGGQWRRATSDAVVGVVW